MKLVPGRLFCYYSTVYTCGTAYLKNLSSLAVWAKISFFIQFRNSYTEIKEMLTVTQLALSVFLSPCGCTIDCLLNTV